MNLIFFQIIASFYNFKKCSTKNFYRYVYTFISFRAIDLFVSARDWPFVYFQKNPRFGKIFISAVIFILYNVYFIGTLVHQTNQNVDFRYWEFCDGHGFLIIITAIVYFGLFYYNIFIPLFGDKIYNNVFKPIGMYTKVRAL